jgi:hypothetical protein
VLAVLLHVLVDVLRGASQGQLAQGQQIAPLEEVFDARRACSGR